MKTKEQELNIQKERAIMALMAMYDLVDNNNSDLMDTFSGLDIAIIDFVNKVRDSFNE